MNQIDKSKLQTHSVTSFFGTFATSDDDDIAVFCAPFDCEIISAHVMNGSDLSKSSANYLILTLTDKGSAGSGSDAIATVNTSATDMDEFDALSMGTISATHGLLSEGDVVSLVKTHNGTGANASTDVLQCAIKFRRR